MAALLRPLAVLLRGLLGPLFLRLLLLRGLLWPLTLRLLLLRCLLRCLLRPLALRLLLLRCLLRPLTLRLLLLLLRPLARLGLTLTETILGPGCGNGSQGDQNFQADQTGQGFHGKVLG